MIFLIIPLHFLFFSSSSLFIARARVSSQAVPTDFLNLHANRDAGESWIIKGPLLHIAEQARATRVNSPVFPCSTLSKSPTRHYEARKYFTICLIDAESIAFGRLAIYVFIDALNLQPCVSFLRMWKFGFLIFGFLILSFYSQLWRIGRS